LTALPSGVGGPAAPATATLSVTETPETVAAVVAPTKPPIPTPAPAVAATATPRSSPSPTPAPETVSAPAPSGQPAAVSSSEAPAQEIVVGALRVAIANAVRAESLPSYGLPPGTGEWVVLVAELTNEGDAPASLAMGDFRLFDRGSGRVAALDSGTDVIARLAGFDPARAASDVIALDPGSSAEALLLYLLPPGSSDDVALLVGQSAMDLAPSLALGKTAAAAAPELIETAVTEVLDGGRIAVDFNGKLETVSYLGFVPPAAGGCFAAEATAANAELVAGKSVWLERQAADRDTAGALRRDVWIADADGNRVLVAARLLEAGAGDLAVAAPDTRYEAWLAASAALARSNGAGRWSACPEPAAAGDDAPRLAFTASGWRERWRFSLR
jgi:endonuclease YncB( thermonuclease family)